MTNGDKWVLRLLVTAAITLIGISISIYLRYLGQLRVARTAMVMKVSPQIVIGPHPTFRGNAQARYTLVEWGDYQCPPCRANEPAVKRFLSQNKKDVRFTFRNLPLEDLHVFALRASLVGEASRAQGKFWPVHDDLYTDELSWVAIDAIVKKEALNQDQYEQALHSDAKLAVDNDLATAHRLHLDTTPTFILCCPDGTVVHLSDLNEAYDYID